MLRTILGVLLAVLMIVPGGLADTPESSDGAGQDPASPSETQTNEPAESPPDSAEAESANETDAPAPEPAAAEPEPAFAPDPVELVLGIVGRLLDGERPVCWKTYPSAPGIPMLRGTEIVGWQRPVPNTSGEPCGSIEDEA